MANTKKARKTASKKAAPKKTTTRKAAKTKKAATKKASRPAKKVTKKATKKATKKRTTKKATKKAAPKKAQSGGSKTRYFKVIEGDEDPHGRFSGTKPKQAAAKALTSILRSREESGESTTGKIKFSIVECTRGSRHKTYNYVGERIELEEPMQVTIGKGANAKVITYKFNNKVMKDKSA